MLKTKEIENKLNVLIYEYANLDKRGEIIPGSEVYMVYNTITDGLGRYDSLKDAKKAAKSMRSYLCNSDILGIDWFLGDIKALIASQKRRGV